jgi:hypothetical protein
MWENKAAETAAPETAPEEPQKPVRRKRKSSRRLIEATEATAKPKLVQVRSPLEFFNGFIATFYTLDLHRIEVYQPYQFCKPFSLDSIVRVYGSILEPCVCFLRDQNRVFACSPNPHLILT